MDLAFRWKDLRSFSISEVMDAVRIDRAPIIRFAYAIALFSVGFASGCDESNQNREPAVRLTEVEEVAVGKDHSCALRRDGTVVCWGYNVFGQLGSEPEKDDFEALDPVGITTEHVSGHSRHASAVDGLSGVQHIAAGAGHTCAIANDGSVWCWGDAAAGQLGNGDFSIDDCDGRPCSRKPVQAIGIDNAIELSLGDQHSCARLEDGSLRCWGSNAVGRNDEELDRCDKEPCATTPVDIPFDHAVRQVRAGDFHTCALLINGSVFCWGTNDFGQLGISNPPTRPIGGVDVLQEVDQPSQANLSESIDRFAVARFSGQKSCAVADSGAYYCWGRNDFGQLGIGLVETELCWTSSFKSISCATEPRRVALDPEIEVEKFVLADETGCAVSLDGRLLCWGRADSAQLGREAVVDDLCVDNRRCSRSPIAISTEERISDVAMSSRYICALQMDNRVACWGWGYPESGAGASKSIDCSSSLDPCYVETSWSGRLRELLIDHFDRFCVLTHAGEIHCLGKLIRDSRSIESEPMKVYP